MVRADDQWRKGGCSSFLKFWYAPLTRGGVMVVFSKMQPTVWSFGLCDCHFDLNPPRMAVCVWVFLPVWLLAPSLKSWLLFRVENSQKGFLPLLPKNPDLSVWISKKKSAFFYVDLCSKRKSPPSREKKSPCAFPLLSYLYGSLPLWEFLFPLLMRVDGLFSMESMTADMECTTIRVRGSLFCPPKGSLIQPQYFLIRCIFPDLKII